MATWIKCMPGKNAPAAKPNAPPIYVNLDLVRMMFADDEEGGAVLFFGPDKGDSMIVAESPEELIAEQISRKRSR